MSKLRSIMFFVLAFVLVAALCPNPARTEAAPLLRQDTARVRFVHASFDAPSLDAYMDGKLMAGGVRGVAEYADVPVGEHVFSWRAVGGTDDLASVTQVVEANQRVTVAAINVQTALEAKLYVDDVSAPVRNAARIKVINAVADGGPLTATMGEFELAKGLAYGDAGEGVFVYAGYYDIAVTAEDGTALTSKAQYPVNEDHTYTFFVVGSAAANSYRIVDVESTVLKPEATSSFSFAHLAQGVGALDAHINKEPVALYPGVPFASVQQSFVAAPGPYLIDLYEAGANPETTAPLASGTVILGPNQNMIFVAQGDADTLAVGGYAADLSPLPPQSARLSIVNLAVGNPPFKVETMEGMPLLDALDVMGSGDLTLPSGGYNIRFVDASTGVMMMEQGGITMPAGTSTLMLAFDDDPLDPLINAVSVPFEGVPLYASVRWAHLNIWGPVVDIYLDGEKVVSSLAYQSSTDYELYPPKIYELAVYPAGSDPASTRPLDTDTIELRGENFPRTIYIYGPADQAQLNVAPDSLEMLSPGMARIRFINAAIDSPGVAVINPADGSTVVPSLGFGQFSDNSNVSAGVYSFNFVSNEIGGVGAVKALEVEEGKVYTIVLGGVVSEQPGPETFILVTEP